LFSSMPIASWRVSIVGPRLWASRVDMFSFVRTYSCPSNLVAFSRILSSFIVYRQRCYRIKYWLDLRSECLALLILV
jgi:hypothetical protein